MIVISIINIIIVAYLLYDYDKERKASKTTRITYRIYPKLGDPFTVQIIQEGRVYCKGEGIDRLNNLLERNLIEKTKVERIELFL